MVTGADVVVKPVAVIHADSAFSIPERNAIDDSAKVWNLQTGGLAKITIVYDLDFDSLTSIQEHISDKHHLMARMESWMSSVQDVDTYGAKVLGWVSPSGGIHNPWKKPIFVAFVMDRMLDRAYTMQVMVHEFGHVLGLPHLASPQALMYPSIIVGRSACLKKPDLAAFCEVAECGTVQMVPCE